MTFALPTQSGAHHPAKDMRAQQIRAAVMEDVSRDASRWTRVRHWRAARVKVKRERVQALRAHRGAVVGTPSGNRRMGRQMAAQRGWRGVQWTCLSALGYKESGWRHWARNPSSGAWGIGQFLGATRRAYAHLGATSHRARRQINAMLHYIGDRYGNPCNALAFHRRHNYY